MHTHVIRPQGVYRLIFIGIIILFNVVVVFLDVTEGWVIVIADKYKKKRSRSTAININCNL